MIRFESDYLEGAVPEILEALAASAGEQHPGYGTDERTEHAKELIRQMRESTLLSAARKSILPLSERL